jgi:hypothetical protein
MKHIPSWLGLAALMLAAPACAQYSAARTVQQAFDIAPNAGAFAELRVACPVGQFALSGGLDTHGAGSMEITTLAPTFDGVALIQQPNGPRTAPDGWLARAINYGVAPERAVLSVVCAPVNDLIVSIDEASLVPAAAHPSGVALGIVLCFDGYVALGGGVEASAPGTIKLTGSSPIFPSLAFLDTLPAGVHPAPNAWLGQAVNQAALPGGRIKTAAICGRPAAAVGLVSNPVSASAATHRSAAVTCPTGYLATGGGAMSGSSGSSIVTVSTPTKAGAARPVDQTTGTLAAPAGWHADLFNHAAAGSDDIAVGATCVKVAETPEGAAVNVYEFYNSTLKHFFRTSSAGEADAIDGGSAGPGWQRTADNFVAFAPGYGDRGNDVCRFYTFGANSHFYTAFAEECEGLQSPASGWVYESLAYRIPLPQGGQCGADTVPVHRLYNNRFMFNDSNHRFTTQPANIAPLEAQGWVYEGVAFCALNHSGG